MWNMIDDVEWVKMSDIYIDLAGDRDPDAGNFYDLSKMNDRRRWIAA